MPTSFRVMSRPKLGAHATVKRLVSDTGGWNVELVKENFLDADADNILSLPVGSTRVADSLMWHYEQSGIFTVKSAYWLGCGLSNPSSSSGLNGDESWWKFLWKAEMPAKVRVFIWRACKNWIATTENLKWKSINVSARCPICSKGCETTLHAVWGCCYLEDFRNSWHVCRFVRRGNKVQLLDFLQDYYEIWDKENMALFCVILWRIWFHRNQVVHGLKGVNLEEVVNWAALYLSDFREANKRSLLPVARHQSRVGNWQPPCLGRFKLNCDATINKLGRSVRVGIVVHDCYGYVVASNTQRIQATYNPQVAEAVAIYRGIMLAQEAGFWQVEIEI
ncbi:hypothetical protein Dsin_001177 [Dipteronia sinensis]|uniref:Reverse transcriptase zinc-binding domain-containing protein n=1 Tax=Dipteronia sinensis TaxID=43782 RepID=A0AAE0EI74_9ROSI|nr:hypothetical protein Dsin_001177 [Dipteronia sinensis]